jgi:phospholipid/cholesterol/gamma-HCH transport system substrate-binding protein
LDNITDLKKDANARITILEITGGKKLEINPGNSNEKFDISYEMPGETPPDLPELISVFGAVSMDLTMLIRRMDTVLTAGTTLLDNGKAVQQLRRTFQNLDEISASLNSLIHENRSGITSSIKDLKFLTGELKTSYSKYEPRFDTLINNVNSLFSSAKFSITKVDSVLAKADLLLADLHDFTANVKNGNSIIYKLIYDKNFSNRIDSTFNELSNLFDFIKQNGVNVNIRLGTRP